MDENNNTPIITNIQTITIQASKRCKQLRFKNHKDSKILHFSYHKNVRNNISMITYVLNYLFVITKDCTPLFDGYIIFIDMLFCLPTGFRICFISGRHNSKMLLGQMCNKVVQLNSPENQQLQIGVVHNFSIS